MGDPISLIIYLLVIALIMYLVFWALGQIPLPQPIRTVIVVLIAIILILYIVRRFGLL